MQAGPSQNSPSGLVRYTHLLRNNYKYHIQMQASADKGNDPVWVCETDSTMAFTPYTTRKVLTDLGKTLQLM